MTVVITMELARPSPLATPTTPTNGVPRPTNGSPDNAEAHAQALDWRSDPNFHGSRTPPTLTPDNAHAYIGPPGAATEQIRLHCRNASDTELLRRVRANTGDAGEARSELTRRSYARRFVTDNEVHTKGRNPTLHPLFARFLNAATAGIPPFERIEPSLESSGEDGPSALDGVVGDRCTLTITERASGLLMAELLVWWADSNPDEEPPDVAHWGPLHKLGPTLRRHGLTAAGLARALIEAGHSMGVVRQVTEAMA